MASKLPRDPLGPIEFVTTFLLAISGFLILLSLVLTLLDDSSTFLGGGEACVSVRSGSPAAVSYELGHITTGSTAASEGSAPDRTSINPSRYQVCAVDFPDSVWRRMQHVGTSRFFNGPAPHPTTSQHWWNRMVVWPQALYGLGALAFVLRLTRRARREGFFVAPVARGLSRLGAYLAIGSVFTAVVVLLAKKQLIDTMVRGTGYRDIGLNASWVTIVTGIGLVTLGRVMAHAVAMREELDATV